MKSDLSSSAMGPIARRSCRAFQCTAIGGLIIRWGTVLLLCAMTIGCAGMRSGYKGTPARPENRYPLAEMEGRAGLWKSKDVALHYNTVVNNDTLGIKGTVERLNTIKHFSMIDRFIVQTHFLNADGLILEDHTLWVTGAGQDTRFVRWTFDKSFPLPVGATAIGFSYRGTFFDDPGNHDGRSGWDVRQKP